jgi:hypothetical protein
VAISTPGPKSTQWPSWLAYGASAIFSLASAGTNLNFGWQKGTDIGSSLVWAAVSIAVSAVFALSWPALIRSIDAKQWTRAAMVGVALLVTGTYSISAALGSAMGGRTSAAIEEKDSTDKRAKLQTAYDTAKAELDTLATTKPTAEIQTQIESTRAELSKLAPARSVAELEALQRSATQRGCPTGSALRGPTRTSCPRYDVELARAWERQRLTNKIAELTKDTARAEQRRSEQREKAKASMDKATEQLASMHTPKVANSDAVALATYMQGLGIDIDAERVNKLLVLLAVLVVECGGGLSLAVGMALGEKAPSDQTVPTGTCHEGTVQSTEKPVVPGELAPTTTLQSPSRSARDRLLQMVGDAKGGLRATHQALGKALGISATRAGQLLKQLAADGAIRVRTSKTGSVITLAPKLVGAC